MHNIYLIIPALNEEEAIPEVLNGLPDTIKEVVLVDNGSTDHTAEIAKQHGATVVSEPIPGYGKACLKGIAYLNEKANPEDILVFMDADRSDDPSDLSALIRPIENKEYDLVIGSRVAGKAEKGSLTLVQRFGNWLATRLIALFYGYRFTDLGPFRAIRWDKLERLNMQDQNYGWTVEMQAKALKQQLRVTEIPVKYRNRIGTSKISGTVKGSVMAGYKIITTIFKCL